MSETVISRMLFDRRPGREPVPDAAVVVVDKQIQEVLGRARKVEYRMRGRDLKGKTLMPG